MPLESEKIRNNLHSGLAVRVLSDTDSTNNEAKRRAKEDEEAAILYAADTQSSGRGRLGRSFYSPPGGLYMTLSIPLSSPAESIQRLTCAAAVAVCDAISDLTDLSPMIKWVNDIYVSNRKVAGILCELVLDELNRPLRVIIGVGVNLTTNAFPADIAEKAGNIGDVSAERLCALIADNLMNGYGQLNDNSFLEKYVRLNLCIGKTIRYADARGEHTATATGIAEDGSLIVSDGGSARRLNSGEISVKLT